MLTRIPLPVRGLLPRQEIRIVTARLRRAFQLPGSPAGVRLSRFPCVSRHSGCCRLKRHGCKLWGKGAEMRLRRYLALLKSSPRNTSGNRQPAAAACFPYVMPFQRGDFAARILPGFQAGTLGRSFLSFTASPLIPVRGRASAAYRQIRYYRFPSGLASRCFCPEPASQHRFPIRQPAHFHSRGAQKLEEPLQAPR